VGNIHDRHGTRKRTVRQPHEIRPSAKQQPFRESVYAERTSHRAAVRTPEPLWMSLLRRVGLTAARRSPMEAELCGLRSCVFTALAEVVWLFNALAIMLRESLKTISNKLTPSVRVERTVNPKPAVVELLNSG
jgi:hypothetical protein